MGKKGKNKKKKKKPHNKHLSTTIYSTENRKPKYPKRGSNSAISLFRDSSSLSALSSLSPYKHRRCGRPWGGFDRTNEPLPSPILQVQRFNLNFTQQIEWQSSFASPIHLSTYKGLTKNSAGYYHLGEEIQFELQEQCNKHYDSLIAKLTKHYDAVTVIPKEVHFSDKTDRECIDTVNAIDLLESFRFKFTSRKLTDTFIHSSPDINLDYMDQTNSIHSNIRTPVNLNNVEVVKSLEAWTVVMCKLSSQKVQFPEPVEDRSCDYPLDTIERQVKSIVWLLMCSGEPESSMNCDCFDNSVVIPTAVRCLLIVAGSTEGALNDMVMATLFDMIIQPKTTTQGYTSHGLQHLVAIISIVAARHPKKWRGQVIDTLDHIYKVPEKYNSRLNNFEEAPQWFLTGTVTQVIFLKATQCSANIRKCFKKRILDESMQGGYYEFVQKMEMKIKMNDSVIKEEINNPSLWSFAGETSEQFEEKSKNVQQRLLAEAMLACQAQSSTAKDPSKKSCAQCGSTKSSVEGKKKLLTCSQCKFTYYCSSECQKKHWKEGGHKKICKKLAKASKKEMDSKKKASNKKKTDKLDNEKHLDQWAKTMSKHQTATAKSHGFSNREHMSKLGFDVQFLSGLTIGDWKSVTQRVIKADSPFQFYRNQKTFCKRLDGTLIKSVKVGDKVKIHPGNGVKWFMVGKIATVLCRLERLDGAAGDSGLHWIGLDIDNMMMHEGNLEVLY